MVIAEINYFRKSLGYLIIGVLLIFLAISLNEIYSFQRRPEFVTKEFSQTLHQKERLLSDIIQKMKRYSFQKMNPNLRQLQTELKTLYKNNGIILFVYENDSLVYWSSNSISANEKLSGNIIHDSCFLERQKNGWYEVEWEKFNHTIYIGKILIRNQYIFENEYLKDQFEKGFNVPEGSTIDTKKTNHQIYASNGTFLFSLKIPSYPKQSYNEMILLFFIYLAGYIFIIISVYFLYLRLRHFFK